MIPLNLVL